MHGKLKTHLIGLAVSLGFIATGFALGEPPKHAIEPGARSALAETAAQDASPLADSAANRRALRRHLALPYVSLPALLPSKES
jgi:hypothetical protein